jgi:uncharacterized alpha/beta hydrolase family protein
VNLIKKAQTWSIDILIAVFIFVAIFIMFIGIMTSMSDTQQKDRLSERGEKITKILSTENPVAFLKGSTVDENKLKAIVGDYDALRDQVGYDKFCIYFEDENGDLVPVEGVVNGDKVTFYGMGNNESIIGGTRCGEPVP